MDRLTWMYKIPRVSHAYVNGVNEFIACAVENLKKKQIKHGKEDMITCPCRDCYNLKKYPNIDTVREHLFHRGFMEDYTKWIWHGEGIHTSKTETSSKIYESYGDSMPRNEEDDAENDRVEEMIQDVEEILVHQPEVLENLVDDSKRPLYHGCNVQFTRLSTTLKLCKLKVKNGWSDKSFTEMLKLLAEMLPAKNELPTSTYEVKKILCPMGMNVKKIHACPNDYVLFRKEHEHLHTCSKCGASRYKRDGNNSSINDKRPPVKVLRYLPIVERFRRLFANSKDMIGISVEAFSTEFERGNSIASRDVKKSYYGVIEEIWEIDYKDFNVALFKCKWFDIRRGVRVDESGFTLVDFNRFGHEDDPFILATQVRQVFYIQDPADVRWSIVLQGKRRIIGVDNVEDEEEYNQFDENHPFSIGLQTTSIEDSTDISYARNDHDEGVRAVTVHPSQKYFVTASLDCIRLMDQDEDRREQNREEDREQDREQSSEELVKKRSRVVRFKADINIEIWDLVNQGLKDAIWEDIKTRWKLDDSQKKNVLERAGKQWRDFKGKLTKNYFREGKDPCEKYSFITEDTWKTFKQRRETAEFKLKQMGVSLEADQFVNDAGARKVDNARSSCHSLDPEDYFSTIKVPTLCRLCVIHVERGKVVTARATLFLTNQGEMIHNNPIAPQNVRVSVDDVITEYQLTPLPVPCYEHETIGNATGSFVQWPKDLVMLGQDPILEKKKLQEMTPIQKSSKVESKGSVTPLKQSPQVVGDDINLSDHCAGLIFLLKKRPPSKKSDAFVFEETGDGPIYITLEDVNQFLRMSWLNIPIVELFIKYVSKLCKQLKDDKFAFMLPFRLAIPHNHEQQKCKDEATDYMTSLLVANKDKRYILAPYIQEVLVLEAMVERKLARYERFGLNFLLLNVYSQGMVLGDTRRECRTITRSLDIIKNRVSLRDLS
ncbi:hypothetical protein AgCh_024030 [Apium graveolens]